MDNAEMASSFIGCILTIKTKPGDDSGISDNIIGTVRSIDVDDQTITLDEPMCNGEILPDGFVLRSSQIADLNVCGKTVGDKVMTLLEADFMSPVVLLPDPEPELLPPPPVQIPIPRLLKRIPADKQEEVQALKIKTEKMTKDLQAMNLENESRRALQGGGNGIPPLMGSAFQKPPPKSPAKDTRSVLTPQKPPAAHPLQTLINIKVEPEDIQEQKKKSNKHLLEESLRIFQSPNPKEVVVKVEAAVTTPSKPKQDPRVCYVASELERTYYGKSKTVKQAPGQYSQNQPPAYNVVAATPPRPQNVVVLKNTTPTAVLQKMARKSKEVEEEVAKLDGLAQIQKLVQKKEPSPPKMAAAPVITATTTPSEGKTYAQTNYFDQGNPFMVLLRRSQQPKELGQGDGFGLPLPLTPKQMPSMKSGFEGKSSLAAENGAKILNQISQKSGNNNLSAFSSTSAPSTSNSSSSIVYSPVRQNGSYANQSGNNNKLKLESTFDMSVDEIFAEEFNFEMSNAMFEKLPIDVKKPVKTQPLPQFSQTDTTVGAERVVPSIRLGKGLTSPKNFVSDTGVLIPAVDLRVRSKILNAAHDSGLTHSRTVEVMGRAAAQLCIPFLGNSCRLSPEREEERPSVLIVTGPNWQGAVGICAARILASQGVKTFVYAKNKELNLCETEEKLYLLTGQTFTRESMGLASIKFDLVILAKDSQMEQDLAVSPVYLKWVQDKTVLLIDPPVLNSYRRCFEQGNYAEAIALPPRRICVLTPTLPLAYGSDHSVKFFLVNLGIPQSIFEDNGLLYKSPFGDKLTIQIFSEKSQPSSSNSASSGSQ